MTQHIDTFRNCKTRERTCSTSRGVYRLTEKSLRRIMSLGRVTHTSWFHIGDNIIMHNEYTV